jgi:hypothetical protein
MKTIMAGWLTRVCHTEYHKKTMNPTILYRIVLTAAA